MSDNYNNFVIESINSHQQTLAEQLKVNEDVNRYSNWFLALTTVGVGLLISRFETISVNSWLSTDNIETYLILVGILLFISIILGVLHQRYSIKERNCIRIHIAHLRKLKLVLIADFPKIANKEITDDLDNQIFRGQLFKGIPIPDIEATISQTVKLRKLLSRILTIQQIFSVSSYFLFFMLSITR